MAVIFADSAATYDSQATMILAKGYSIVSTNPAYRQAGAWGAGSYSYNFSLNTAGASYVSRGFTATSTATWGFRMFGGGGSGTTAPNVSTMGQFGPINLYYDSTSRIQVYNTVTGTILFTTASLTNSVWHYFEVQVAVSSTVGTVTVWVEGIQVYAGTALNTGTSNIGGFLFGAFGGTVSGATVNVTDIYVTDTTNASGAGNVGALGPVRVETLAPSGDGSNNAWTVAVGANAASANQYNPTATTGFVSDTGISSMGNAGLSAGMISPYDAFGFTSELAIVPSATPNIITTSAGTSGFAVTAGTSYTASALVLLPGGSTFQAGIRWYTSSGTVIQTDLSSNFSASTWAALYFNGTAPATAAFAALVIEQSGTGNYDVTGVTFTATPATLSGSAFTGPIIKNPSAGATVHYPNVNDAVADTGTFNRSPGASANVGDKDSYAMADLASTSGTPLAVVVTDIALKENTNPRSIAPILKSGASTSVGTSQALNNDTAYHAYQSIWELDPNTAAAWTIANVNAAEAGIEISA